MLPLPTFNTILRLCPVSPAEFAAHPQGRFCGHCQRMVHDFSQSTDPVADLASARAAEANGRVCGRFGAAQVQTTPGLSRQLRWFVVALVLVVAQGLTAREALAQVHEATPAHRPHPAAVPKHAIGPPTRTQTVVACELSDGTAIEGPEVPYNGVDVYTYMQQMPSFRDGDMDNLVAHFKQQVRRPAETKNQVLSGRVFVNFIVGKDGLVRDTRIVKGWRASADAEMLRVARALTGFTPGRQNG